MISVAEYGRLQGPMDMATLMDYLTRVFTERKAERRSR